MKYCSTFLFCFFGLIIVCGQKDSSVDSTLNKVYKRLNNAKFLRYDLTRESDFSSEDYKNTTSWKCYFDFDQRENTPGFRFQIENSQFKEIYNGTETFQLNKQNSSLEIAEQISDKSFDTKSYFYNSLITLRNILPLIISDDQAVKTIKDSVIGKNLYQAVTVDLGKRRINNLGTGFDQMTTEYNFIYELMIDKSSSFPLQIIQKNNLNRDFIKTIFKNIETQPKKLSESSWFYSTYKNEFKLQKDEKKKLSAGSLAPEFELKVFNENRFMSLKNLKGDVILLDFWIKNCNACIESVPHINALQEKFKNKKFKVISINSYDSLEKIGWFSNKYKVKYPILSNGKTVADTYAVTAFPNFILINQSGKIVSVTEGFDEKNGLKIEAEIRNLIK
ncbi:TlpA family protein disulfide reductase [Chryseobacterium caseinilyticum]|uniref:Redoxin domain-containing protein n=1 Tax=Chryseobacterium caseinilyticum TaxID=2771428 RepID=A0ABR8ZFF9_9FLAO|nr:redoxin domain-containing protein [Chryseobacterium caseinilyticum]MBD8083977.1 redoxin domain-containing protein [Chryseobacterium caseinilyticum]